MTDATGNVIEIPAPVNDEIVIPKPKRAKAPKVAKTQYSPKEMATELHSTPQKVRRHLRILYGVQHETWVIDAKMAEALRKVMGKKA